MTEELYAVADPNWSEGDIVLVTTIADTPVKAMVKALWTEERGANLYSGAELHVTPRVAGSWERLVRQGYKIVRVEIKIQETVEV